MKNPYPDLVQRLFLQPGTLDRLFPKEPRDPDQVRRIREATDAEIAPNPHPKASTCIPLLRSLLFYRFDALDEAHQIVQAAPSDLAAYIHGMIHRREGDLDNARYWFRRSGVLRFFADAHRRAANDSPNMAKQENWDPYLFVGLAEQARFGDGDLIPECVALQKAEFETVFADTFRRTVEA